MADIRVYAFRTQPVPICQKNEDDACDDDDNFDDEVFAKSYPPRRRKKWYPDRSSLCFRNHVGRPGSRRYNRYLNSAYLNGGMEDWEEIPDKHALKAIGLQTPGIEPTSLFRELFEDEQLLESWLPFSSVTEEEQERLLSIVAPGDESDEEEIDPRPLTEQHFMRLDPSTRKLIRRQGSHHLVKGLEEEIQQFLNRSPKVGPRKTKHFEVRKRDSESLDIVLYNSKDGASRMVFANIIAYTARASTLPPLDRELLSSSTSVDGGRDHTQVHPAFMASSSS
eukprot:CAMPEP_0174254526 /NCGR_PEP_ID=MMETSP0439-20130205/3845_1 /TAXON_ID=0 /ORGANISM="Stereomyxa ramosa, Strain Chinc5" /LENGTH=279 /DNA_ID=CAMNT_0015336161 /DNA_START=176 /DNA_END=1016 /DNA_ORIENTATION=-